MSKMIFAGAFSFLALSVMGMSSFYTQKLGVGVGVDPIITSGVPQLAGNGDMATLATDPSSNRIPNSDMFILTGEQTDEICIFERAPLEGKRFARIQIDADCAPLYPELTKAVHWQEREDGLIDLLDESGMMVASFANSDGITYITLSPSSINLTFSPI